MNESNYPVWPGWETVRIIGRGSYGNVYEIRRDLFGDGHVERAALKHISIPHSESEISELRGEGMDEESITETFREMARELVNEYRLMRKLNDCPYVVSCDDVRHVQHKNDQGWDILLKMELLTPLLARLGPEGTLPENQVVRLGADICRALAFCQRFNIIHRDIKPQNIFVSDSGIYKLGDFGIARAKVGTGTGTARIGTYDYMAPEVYHAEHYGATADLYSLGIVLYWLLNRRHGPFQSLDTPRPSLTDKEAARQRRLAGEAIPDPAEGSEALKAIVRKACAYDPKDRFQSAEEMLLALEALEHRRGVAAAASPAPTPPPAPEEAQAPEETVFSAPPPVRTPPGREEKKAPSPAPRRKLPLALIAVLVLALVLGGILLPRLRKPVVEPSPDPVPTQETVPTPAQEAAPEPVQETEPTPVQTTEPDSAQEPAPEPAQEPTPEPVQEPTPEPVQEPTPEPAQEPTPEPVQEAGQSDETQQNAESSDLQPGTVITLGRYEQNGNRGDGREELSWLVLAAEEDRVLVVSTEAFECVSYASNGKADWSGSSLRSWLNGNFLSTAFTKEERARILSGEDSLFLLTVDELSRHFPTAEDRLCAATRSAKANGAYLDRAGNCWYWTADQGKDASHVAVVKSDGSFSTEGQKTTAGDICVRPAMWISR